MIRFIRRRSLVTTAFSALTFPLAFPGVGAAQDYGVHHVEDQPLALDVELGSTVEGDRIGIFAENGPLDLDNAGTVRGNGKYDGLDRPPEGGVTIAGGTSTVVNSGTISGAGHGISTASFYNPATNSLEARAIVTIVTNSGSIIGESNDGVRLIGGGTVTNSGLIAGRAGGGADGISMYAYGGQDTSGQTGIGSVVNQAGGRIEGNRFGIIVTGGGTIENDGVITGVAGGLVMQDNLGGSGKTGSIINGGTISGAFGVQIAGALDAAEVTNSGTITATASHGISNLSSAMVSLDNRAGGTITGAQSGVFGEAGAIVVNNAGTIRGNGSYDGLDLPPDAGVVLAQAGSAVTNSGSISGAGLGISTRYLYNEVAQRLEGYAISTVVTNSGSIIGERNDGVRLIGGGAVTNSGLIAGRAGGGADGISMYAYDEQDTSGQTSIGSVVNQAGGTIEGNRFGIILTGGGTVENAGTIDGNITGLLIQAAEAGKTAAVTNSGTINGGVRLNVDSATLVNSGIIASEAGAAIESGGAINLTNSGRLSGTGAYAAILSDFDDVVTLQTGSSISGALGGGAGIDLLRLDGSQSGPTNLQTVTASEDFETLAVVRGHWTASGNPGHFDSVDIAAGATLDVRDTAAGSAIVTGVVRNDGLLILNFNSNDSADIDALAISGSGGVRLDGEAAFVVDADSLTYTGLTTIANGSLTLVGQGQVAGDVHTSGNGAFVLGDGGTSGAFTGDLVNDGQFVFNRSDDYQFLGGFTGAGSFTKMGGGLLTFAGDYGFTGTTTIMGGAVKFAGQLDPETEISLESGTLDISGTPQTIAELSGAASSSIVVEDSQLTVNQDTNTSYAGAIQGNGALVKTGSGTLNLTGNSSFTGPTIVDDGALAVNGTIASVVTVNSGGTLRGTGTIGGGQVGNGGELAPGNSIGTLHVADNILFAPGSIYEVEVNAAGESDRVIASGSATIQGGRVEVLAAPGIYRPFTEYVILEAAAGVNGRFTDVTTDLAFLTPDLRYGNGRVTLELQRNDIQFSSIANTANQASVADAVELLGVRSSLYTNIALQNEASALAAFDALSGETYASAGSVFINDSRHVRDALLDAGRASGTHGWAQVMGSWGDREAAGGTAAVDASYRGLIGGLSFGGDGLGAGFALGTSKSELVLDERGSSASADATIAGVHISYRAGGLRMQLGAAYAWHDVTTTRAILFPGFSETATGNYDGKTRQIFAHFGYTIPAGGVEVEPFARLEQVKWTAEEFTEVGTTAALDVAEPDQRVQFLSIGARLGGGVQDDATGLSLAPRGSLAWRHGWGDLDGRSQLSFAAGGTGFSIAGARLAKDAAEVEAGLELVSGRFRVGVAYRGLLSSGWTDHGVKASINARF